MKLTMNQLIIIGIGCLIVRQWEYKKTFTDNTYLNKMFKSVFRDSDQEVELVYKY